MNSIVEGVLSDDVEWEQPNYRSYLLRLWWAEDESATALRILIEESATGQRTGFSSLEDLVAFLYKEADINAHSLTLLRNNPQYARSIRSVDGM